jgi:hypothetical protein
MSYVRLCDWFCNGQAVLCAVRAQAEGTADDVNMTDRMSDTVNMSLGEVVGVAERTRQICTALRTFSVLFTKCRSLFIHL